MNQPTLIFGSHLKLSKSIDLGKIATFQDIGFLGFSITQVTSHLRGLGIVYG